MKNSRAQRFFILSCLILAIIQPLSSCMVAERLTETVTPETSGQTVQTTAESSLLPVTDPQTVSWQETTTASSETSTETTTEGTTTVIPTATPKPTPKPTLKPTPTPNTNSPYYLYAELGSFALQVYKKDAKGAYTVPVRRIRIAIGKGTMTPRGKFTLSTRERWHAFSDKSYAQYAIRYTRSGLYIHAPLYNGKDIYKMYNEYYTSIGTASTAGCLRMTTGDAYWIYKNCPSGTILEIVLGSPRGLTAPALPPMIHYHQDPTDPLIATTPTETTEATTSEETTETTEATTTEEPTESTEPTESSTVETTGTTETTAA